MKPSGDSASLTKRKFVTKLSQMSSIRGLHYAADVKRVVRDQADGHSIPCLPCKHAIHEEEVQL